jgi:predicted metal-binding protein
MDQTELLQQALNFANQEEGEALHGILMDLDDLVFENRVRMNCFYCGRYNRNWKCPPHLPDLDYPAMFREFDYGALVYVKMPLAGARYEEVRTNSSVRLHKGMLRMEQYLWQHHGDATYLSFIAGACKLCKNGCGETHCNNPYLSRSPIEATGVNIVKTAAKYQLDLSLPPKEFMYRCGLLVW